MNEKPKLVRCVKRNDKRCPFGEECPHWHPHPPDDDHEGKCTEWSECTLNDMTGMKVRCVRRSK